MCADEVDRDLEYAQMMIEALEMAERLDPIGMWLAKRDADRRLVVDDGEHEQ